MGDAAEACYRISWGARILGVAVLVLCLAATVGLLLTGGAPTWTWVVVGFVGVAAAWASAANFGDRIHVDEVGLRYENPLLGRSRRATWDQVVRAVNHEGRTWFLEVDGQRRWILDQLDGHEMLRIAFQERGVAMETRRAPRLWDRNPTARG